MVKWWAFVNTIRNFQVQLKGIEFLDYVNSLTFMNPYIVI